MAVYSIRAPDGRTIQIRAVDEATAIRGAQEWAQQNPKAASSTPSGQALPPSGLQPGTREYADWAAEQARAGNSLPQISDPAPEAPYGPAGAIVPVQFQEGTGQPRLAMPQLLTDAWNAVQAPGKALQGEYDELRVSPEGAVEPFDRRMTDDAANLAGMASPMSAVSRAAPVAAAKGMARTATPEIDDLYAAKAAAYAQVDKMGARYSPGAIDGLYGDMIRRAGQGNISPDRHPRAFSMLVDLQQNPRSMTLTELDQLRQVIRRDLVGGDAAEAHFGREYISAIDDFIENAGPAQISGVTGPAAHKAITTARHANTVLRKSETLQDALDAARLRAASTGSGGNIDNATRQELRKIIQSPKKSMGFTKDELAQMEAIVTGGGKMQDALRLVGKLSPSGNGLMAALGLGATVTNPLMVAAPAAGLVAKTLADRATQGSVKNLTGTVRRGDALANAPRTGQPSALEPKATTTLLEQNFGQRVPRLTIDGRAVRVNA